MVSVVVMASTILLYFMYRYTTLKNGVFGKNANYKKYKEGKTKIQVLFLYKLKGYNLLIILNALSIISILLHIILGTIFVIIGKENLANISFIINIVPVITFLFYTDVIRAKRRRKKEKKK